MHQVNVFQNYKMRRIEKTQQQTRKQKRRRKNIKIKKASFFDLVENRKEKTFENENEYKKIQKNKKWK